MDFSQFDSRSAADEGRPMHVAHPATGAPMLNDDGTPCLVHVLGVEGKIAQAAFKAAAKMEKLPDDASIEEWHERLCLTAEKLITGFTNIDRGDRPATKADVRWFLDLQMANPMERGQGKSFVEQVLRFSGSRGEYLGKSAAASSEPRSNSAGKGQPRKTGRKPARKT